MTKKRLKRMRSLISEARHLQEMLDQPAKTTEYVGDTAKDYRTGKPHSITITGYGQQDYPELKERYYQKLRDIQQEIAFLESFLDQITDPQTRDILRLYYVNGMTQEQIAEDLGFFKNDAQVASEHVEKFWAKVPGIYIVMETLEDE